jgi:hypothetical protein
MQQSGLTHGNMYICVLVPLMGILPFNRMIFIFSLSYVCLSDVICFFSEFGYYSHVGHLLVVSE